MGGELRPSYVTDRRELSSCQRLDNCCLILITFKKVNETALNPRVMIPISDEHGQLTSSVCYFVTRKVGTQNESCAVAFCSLCTQVSLSLVQNDAYT